MEKLTLKQKYLTICNYFAENPIDKTETGNTGKKDYKYASTPQVISAVVKQCHKHNCIIRNVNFLTIPELFSIEKPAYRLKWQLIDCESNELMEFENDVLLDNRSSSNPIMQAGGTQTYAQRYSFILLFNIPTSENDPDGHTHAPSKPQQTAAPRPPQQPQAPKPAVPQAAPQQQTAGGISEAQIKRLYGLLKSNGFEPKIEVEKIKKFFGIDSLQNLHWKTYKLIGDALDANNTDAYFNLISVSYNEPPAEYVNDDDIGF